MPNWQQILAQLLTNPTAAATVLQGFLMLVKMTPTFWLSMIPAGPLRDEALADPTAAVSFIEGLIADLTTHPKLVQALLKQFGPHFGLTP